MPFEACIAAALNANEIDEAYANRAREIYREHLAGFEPSMPRSEAMAEAARSAFAYLEEEAAERRRQSFLTLAARRDIMERLDGYRSYRSGENDPFLGATGLFDRLLPGRNGLAVEQQREFWRNQAHAMMDQAFAAFRPDWLLRRRNVPLMENVVRELFGTQTGDDIARTLARSWTDAAEFLRSNFNRFGGRIGLLENWGLPQGHDRMSVRQAGFEEWRSFIRPLLDETRMHDRDGESYGSYVPSLGEIALNDALHHVYDNIITEGWGNREATGAGGRARANTRADERFLIFKDADAWLTYQRRFGEPDPFNTMMRHIDAMSRDISLMQVLGPNPSSTLRWLSQELDRRRATGGLERDRVNNAMFRIEAMYDMTTGRAFAPLNSRLANVSADIGNTLVAAQLGGAVLTAVPSDIGFQTLTRRMNGMPALRLFRTALGHLNPADPAHRLLAVRLGAGAQSFAHVLVDQARYIGELRGHAWSRFLADRVLAASGLSPWTEAGRASFFMDALGGIADNSAHAWADLPENFRNAIGRYRIGEAEWDAIRATPHYDAYGARFIRPEDIAARTDLDPTQAFELAQRLADYAGSETEFAVPSHSLAGAAIARGKTPPGSWQALWADSFLKYKTFGMTLLMTHGRRLLAQGNLQRRGAYFGALVLTSIFAGAIALQMKEIAAGRDPRDMEDWRFWPAALIQGGGLGIIGDFVYSGLQGAARTGGGMAETASGPIVGLFGDAFRALFGVAMTPQQRDAPAHQATNTLEFTKRYMPGGSIWYARLLLERYLWDAIQEDIDPSWKRRLRSIESWYAKNFHNGFWWRRGDQPGFDRSEISAPDMSTALGSKGPQ